MRYDKEYGDYWAIMKLLFGTSVINLLCGPGLFGKLVSDEVQLNSFDPSTASCNFTIPSVHTLTTFSTGYEKGIPPGMVEHRLDVAEDESATENKQFTMTFDGKYLAEGYKSDRVSDVDLWG